VRIWPFTASEPIPTLSRQIKPVAALSLPLGYQIQLFRPAQLFNAMFFL